MILKAYAKLNLLLRVLRRRADGYHDLFSVMQTISLHDRITLNFGTEGVTLSCDDPGLPTDERNLAYRAAEAFYTRLGWEPMLRVHLEKRIPAQAGLGGGSSDAAAALNGLNRLHEWPYSTTELHALAAMLGSDVPFFLRGGCAVAEGRGERLTLKQPLPSTAFVLVCPGFGVETAWAYRNVQPNETVSEELLNVLNHDPMKLEELLPHFLNDLEAPAVERHPEIRQIREALLGQGAMTARMTGSGSAVFGLFPDEKEAESAAQSLKQVDEKWMNEARIVVAATVDCGSEVETVEE
jgi:4-diphosphocytidyl-2-C-methyl-D-erythritol kinase